MKASEARELAFGNKKANELCLTAKDIRTLAELFTRIEEDVFLQLCEKITTHRKKVV